jgi:hypothetical protein
MPATTSEKRYKEKMEKEGGEKGEKGGQGGEDAKGHACSLKPLEPMILSNCLYCIISSLTTCILLPDPRAILLMRDGFRTFALSNSDEIKLERRKVIEPMEYLRQSYCP